MSNPPLLQRLAFIWPVVLLTFLSGCASIKQRYPATGGNHAFITYWAPTRSGKLRLAVKDLIDMKGVVTTAGSEYLAKHSPPARRDARCLGPARQRGVEFVGKTNTTELAVGVSGINVYFGTPRNPITARRDRVPGGSSCGSAVAVADGQADVAFGTDTAGSIRIPAACCGVCGLKTTFGLIPLDGVYPIAPNQLDTVGPLAKDIPRLVEGMDLLKPGSAARYREAVAEHPAASGIRVGRLYIDGTDPRIDQAIDAMLQRKGFKVVKLGDDVKAAWVQATKDAHAVAAACAWLYDQKFKNEPGVSSDTKAVVAVGGFQYGSTYKEALTRRTMWQDELRSVFGRVDFIALPTMKKLPPKIPFLGGGPPFEAIFLGLQNTGAVNLAGNPAIAVPIPVEDRHVPVTSIQLIGRPHSEAQLLNAGRIIEAPGPKPSA